MGAKGQVVIPKAIRDEIGIEPGDEVVFEPGDEEVRIHRLADDPEQRRKRIEALQGTWGGIPGLSTADLEAERREEREARILSVYDPANGSQGTGRHPQGST